jgi:ABC-type multidrug transport system fused ATPase/permease subunit
MHTLSTWTYIFRRLVDDWKLLLSIFVGVVVASVLVAGAPVYLQALERQSLNTAIDRASDQFIDIFTFAPHIPLSDGGLDGTGGALEQAVDRHVADIYEGQERYVRTTAYLVGLPGRPLLDAGQRLSRGYFQLLASLEDHVTLREGRMATDEVVAGTRGPEFEATVGGPAARLFRLSVGDILTLTPSLGNPTRMTVTIVGIVEAADPSEAYWQRHSTALVDPVPLSDDPELGVEVDPEEPPLGLFVTRGALIDGVGKAYPRSLVTSTWYVFVDKERLKTWSASEARDRIAALDAEITERMQGSVVLTGIKSLLRTFERRSFFSSVPLLLLLAIMVLTVLYYMSMMVSYLVQSREGDVALLRSRGVGTLQLLRLYATEGLVLAATAALVAPFLAMGVVAAAGKLPYFSEITGGSFLPVEFRWTPFAVAAGTALLSLAIFVIPGVIGARTGLVIHKLRSSRPPSVPFFHRYYVDIGLLVIGGLVFWELRARGQLISGGLFKDVEVNEALLLAPVLLLTVVALLFMRFFPIFVRFLSGESPSIVHLMAGAIFVSLPATIAAQDVRDGAGLAWVGPAILTAAVAGVYWATARTREPRLRLAGLIAQSGLVALLVFTRPPVLSETSIAPTIGLILLVPAQLLFLFLRELAQAAPVWVSMGLWHMARNPLQYTWLVLLLVLVTGLGVLATTVGGTLDRSHVDRIQYEVGSDIRVTGIPGYLARGTEGLKKVYQTIPGVESVSMALRGSGRVGSNFIGTRFEVLALEPEEWLHISPWYREDFSVRPLTRVLGALQPKARFNAIAVPEGATTIGVWAKPDKTYSIVFLYMVLQDRDGVVKTVTLGELGDPEWHLLTAEIPSFLKEPLELVSVQLYEPVFGPAGSAGSVLLDDIHVTAGGDADHLILDDFEGAVSWTALATSRISTDVIRPSTSEVYNGKASALFSFGKDTDRGIRGVYRSPTGGPMPIVASSSFMRATGMALRDTTIVEIMGRLIPVQVEDVVDFFPTMSSGRGGFILADLDSLLTHINLLSPISTVYPNEVFIAEAPGAGDSVLTVVNRLARSPNSVHDKEALLDSIRLDPLITAGWKAMVLLSIGIVILTAGLGYVTHLLAFADRSRAEMGFLQALGLSRLQTVGLVSLEHLVILVVGLGLGSWAGFQMSTLMVESVAVTENGAPVVPPFILTTDWGFMVPIYAILVGIFVVALLWLARSMLRLDLQEISRVEG